MDQAATADLETKDLTVPGDGAGGPGMDCELVIILPPA